MDDVLALSLAPVLDPDDAELARAATEDRAAFATIYERYRTPVFRYLRARTTNEADAQDLTAATFERAMGAIHRFRPVGGGMVAWLVRIARNAHSDAVRQQRRRGTHLSNDGGQPSNDLSDAVILRSLVEGLPSAQQDAIHLRFAAGLTAREIGGVLGTTEAAAQKLVERGLRALKEAYRDD